MKPERYEEFVDRLNRARTHGALEDLLGQSLLRAHHAVPHDPLIREMLEYRIRKVEHSLKTGKLAPFLKARLFEGEIILGRDVHGGAIRIVLDWLCSGLLTIASSGSGKSNLLYWLISQLAWLTPSVFLFEPYKLQSRLLLPIYRSAGKALVILPWPQWRWNLLQSLGTDPRQHSATAVDLLVRTLDLPGRAAAILRQGIFFLYSKFGVWDRNAQRFPTLFHLFEWTKAQPQLNAASRGAILDRLGAFLLSLTPACGAWTRCWSPTELSRYSIVFELRGASASVRNLLPQSLLFNIFNARMAQGLVNGPLELCLVFEDAQRIFSDRVTADGEVTPLDEATGIVRGAGLCLWPIAQTTIGFSRRTRPNMAIRIFGRLGCNEDYVTLGADCGLNPEQLEYVRHRLVPGTFVGQVGLGPHTLPFLFRVPLARLPAALTEAQVQESQVPLRELPTEFADEFANWHPQDSVTVSESVPASAAKPVGERAVLDESAIRFLQAVLRNPGRPSSAYARLARLGTKQAVEIRNRLVAAGYLREHGVVTGTRGRKSIFLEALPPAYAAVSATGGVS